MPAAAFAWFSSAAFWRRLLVTVGVIVVYLAGSRIPLPGIDAGALGMPGRRVDIPLARVSIFALGVTPIFSVLFVFEIAKLVIPPLARFEIGGPRNAARLRRYLLLASLAMAAIMSAGLPEAYESAPALVAEPGPMFRIGVIMTLIAATALLGWLGDRITLNGLCNGFWLLLLAPSVIRLPALAAYTLEIWQAHEIRTVDVAGAGLYFILATALLVALAKAQTGPTAPADAGNQWRHAINGTGVLDVWPPLLAIAVGGLLVVALALALGSDRAALDEYPLVAVRMVVVAALIAWVAAMRRRIQPAGLQSGYWIPTLAQIAICTVGALLSQHLRLPFVMDGGWLIVAVALVMNALAARAAAAPSLPESVERPGMTGLAG